MTDRILPYGRQTIDDDDVDAVAAVLRVRLPDHRAGRRRASRRPSPSSPGRRQAVVVSSGTAALHAAYAARASARATRS